MAQPISAPIPVLETDRLRLRGHELSDFKFCCSLWSNPTVLRYIGKPATPEDCWIRLLRYRGHWSLLGYGYWLVENRLDGQYMGEVGFMTFHRDISPALGDTPEMGWILMPNMHGKGYASEAVAAAQAWGDAHFGSENSLCIIHPENRPSLRVAEKAGFSNPIITTYKDMPTVILTRGSVALQ